MAIGLNKWLVLAAFSMIGTIQSKTDSSREQAGVSNEGKHPLHVSVMEVNHNATDKTLEVSVKIFTDDFEKVLGQNYKGKIDLVNPTDRPAMEKLINEYVHKHLFLKGDGKSEAFNLIGFEKDNDAVYSYFQVDNVPTLKSLALNNTLMHDMFTDQINLMHVIVGGNRKSTKLNYPDKDAVISF